MRVAVHFKTSEERRKEKKSRKSKKKKKKQKKTKNYSTQYSHVVPHHSTDYAINCLTAQIGRDAVGLVVYGRSL
jgi:nitrate reductase cytochrome c-type subunit